MKNRQVIVKITILLVFITAIMGCGVVEEIPLINRTTDTPTASPTIVPSPTIIPTITPTPIPTPVPAMRIESGEEALFLGDWDRALAEYQLALDTASDSDIRTAALLGLARTYFQIGDLPIALDILRSIVTEFPGSPHTAQAQYFLGETYFVLQRYQEAAEAYGAFIQLKPEVLDSFMQEKRGQALFSAGEYLAAVDAYQLALNAPRLGDPTPVQINIARALTALGDYETALAIYDDLYIITSNDFTRAEINLLRGGIHVLLGDTETAFSIYQDSVARYPRSFFTYLGLVELVDSGQEVSEIDRGIIDYYAGQYALAIAAFDRFQATASVSDTIGLPTSHFFKGLSLIQIDSYDAAISEWESLTTNFDSTSPYWDAAWDEIGYTQWLYLDDYDAAIETYLRFVALVPSHLRAAEFLFFAARIAERDNNLAQAAEIWTRLEEEYPTSSLAYEARFLAGIARFRLGSFQAAFLDFQNASIRAANGIDQSQATFWMAKTYQALGDENGARVQWERTASLDPTGYYSERARDYLIGREIFAPPQLVDFAIDWPEERRLAEQWIRANFSVPDGMNMSNPGPLYEDPRFVRGTELWSLGLYEDARSEFEDLRAGISSDPVANFRLANYLLDLGIYRTAIFCTRQILDLAGMDDAATLTAPPYFNHIRFGLYYSDLVLENAYKNDLHPLLVFSVMRQESLYEGFVSSSAGARGLLQIIPSTGQGIATTLGWPPNYDADDLYRPLVSITLGARYLSDQLDFLDSSIPAALAAYNGGPGNSSVWKNLAGDDPDLFVEIIRFEETRRYVRSIYEIFSIYRRIYDRTE